MEAITYYDLAPLRPIRAAGMTHVDTRTQDSKLENAFLKVAKGEVDVNTALREADELLKQEVAKIKGAN